MQCDLPCLDVGFLIRINLWGACLWYSFGSNTPGHASWFKNLDGTPGGDELLYRYATSYHWTLTQFTLASISVQPQNVTRDYSEFGLATCWSLALCPAYSRRHSFWRRDQR